MDGIISNKITQEKKQHNMKKILLIILILASFAARSQDSVRVTISPQARDVDYILSFVYSEYSTEDLFDSIKVKYRIQNPPSGTETIDLNGYTADWVTVISRLNIDYIAIDAGVRNRVRDLLVSVNQPYLTARIDAMTVNTIAQAADKRQFGRRKGRRN